MNQNTSPTRATGPRTLARYLCFDTAVRLLPLLLLLPMLPAAARAQFDYTTTNGTITITRYRDRFVPDVIPSEIDGLPVTGIGDHAFYGCWTPDNLTIPDGVVTIGEEAFVDCYNLTRITIPASVTNIGNGAFAWCNMLTQVNVDALNPVYNSVDGVVFNKDKTVLCLCPGGKTGNYVIPDGVTKVETRAFYGCPRLTSIKIPKGVKSIGDEAFLDCRFLTSVTMPDDGMNSIGDYAFKCCLSLTSVAIPAGVTNIGKSAFENCGSLASVTIPESVTSIGADAFACCGSLTSVTLPSRVTSIGDEAFYGCSGLTSVTIPNGVTSIGGCAFFGCSGLTSITIPTDLIHMGEWAFSHCSGLTSVTISNGVTSIGDGAFYGCSSLSAVTIPDSVISIGRAAFSDCYNLTNVTLPKEVTSIGDGAFSGCASLSSINIPNGVKSIGSTMFTNCANLSDVTISNGVTSIGESAFENCTSLTSITIPNSVSSIGGSAFSGCASLTSFTFPKCAVDIGSYALAGCSNLTSLTIPKSAPSIGDGAFCSCTNLFSITIPNGVTNIGGGAFGDCPNLRGVYFQGDAPESGWNVFDSAEDATVSEHATVYYLPGTKGWKATFNDRPTVLLSVPTLTWPNPAAIVYGTPLSAIQLNARTTVPGKFVYSPSSGSKLPVGTHTLSVTFTPTDTTHYATIQRSMVLAVHKPAAAITIGGLRQVYSGLPRPATITTVPAGLDVKITYDGELGPPIHAGSYAVMAMVVDKNAEGLKTGTLVIAKGSQTLSFPPLPRNLRLGDSDVAPSATATSGLRITYASSNRNVATIVNGKIHITGVGTTTLTAMQPGNPDWNASPPVRQILTVARGVPVINWASPAAVVSGTPLSSIQLNAQANLPGKFFYSPAIGSKLPVGTHTLSVMFTPTDTAHYFAAQRSVSLTVKKADTTATATGNADHNSTPAVRQNLTVLSEDQAIRAFYAALKSRMESHDQTGFLALFAPDYLHQGWNLTDQFSEPGFLDTIRTFNFNITGITITGIDAKVYGAASIASNNGDPVKTWQEPDSSADSQGIGFLRKTPDGWRVIGNLIGAQVRLAAVHAFISGNERYFFALRAASSLDISSVTFNGPEIAATALELNPVWGGFEGSAGNFTAATRPPMGTVCTFLVDFADGSQETCQTSVKSWVPTAPAISVTPGAGTAVIRWTNVSAAVPNAKCYGVQVYNNAERHSIWKTSENLPLTQTSVAFNADGTATSGLISGQSYKVVVAIIDRDGDYAMRTVDFTMP